jgi:hypothetical protein
MTPTPYDLKLQKIRQRLNSNKGNTQGLKAKLKKMKSNAPTQGDQGQTGQDNPPLPWSAQYESAISQTNNDLNFSNLSLDQQEGMTKQAYGFDDNSNPYSRAAQLQKQYQQNRNQTLNSYASQGQLYAGSMNNARNIDRSNFEQTWDTEKRDYQAKLQDIQNSRLEAARKADEARIAAEAQRLEDAIQEPPDPSESPPEPGEKDKGKGGGKGKGGSKGGRGKNDHGKKKGKH